MLIRTFLPEDRAAVLQLVHDFYTSPGVLHQIPVDYFARAFDEMCADRGVLRGLAVLDDAGVLCGYCQLTFSYSTEAGGRVVHLEELYFDPSCRGKGYGSAVLEFLKREYAQTAARIRLEVVPENTGAARLYERHGFEVLPYQQMIIEQF